MIACMDIAFCVSDGITGALTYAGAWMHVQFRVTTQTIGLLFLAEGLWALVRVTLSPSPSSRQRSGRGL
jgi:hypothetical protein